MNSNNSMFAFKPFETRESFGMIEFMKYNMVLESTSNYFNASYLYKHHRGEDVKCEKDMYDWMKTKGFQKLVEKYTEFLIDTNQSKTIYNNSLLFKINSTKDIEKFLHSPRTCSGAMKNKIPKNDESLKGTYIHPLLLMVLIKRLNPNNAIKMNCISLHYMKESSINDALTNGLIDETNYQYYKESLNKSKVKTHAIVNDTSVEESKTFHEELENKVRELQKQLYDAKKTIIAKDGKIKRRDERIVIRDDKIDEQSNKIDTLIKDIKEQSIKMDSQSSDIQKQTNIIKSQSSDIQEQKAMIKELLADGKETKAIVKDIKINLDDLTPIVKKYCTNTSQIDSKKELIAVLDLEDIYSYTDGKKHIRLICGQSDYVNGICRSHVKEAGKYNKTPIKVKKYKNIANAKGILSLTKQIYDGQYKINTFKISPLQYDELRQGLRDINAMSRETFNDISTEILSRG